MYSQLSQNESRNDVTLSQEYTAELLRNQRSLKRQLYRLKIWNCLLGLGTALCIGLLAFSRRSSLSGDGAKGASPVPEFPIQSVHFRRDEVFANHSDPSAAAAWSALMPTGDGFIIVDEPDKYSLRPGIPTRGGEQYDISVFHQLHCLMYVRTYLYEVLDVAQQGADSEGAQAFLDYPDDHVSHCLDYIRQGLMCNADMTVEWPREEPDASRSVVDGWGVGHQCKSWEAVMQYMEENRFHQPWEMDP